MKEPDVIDAPCVYDLGAVQEMTGGNHDFIVSLVQIFLDTIPPNSHDMVEACNKGNWDMVSKLAHKLKSTVDMMRMETIRQEIRTIELDAKNHTNREHLGKLVLKVDHAIQLASIQLKQEFEIA